MRDPTVPPLYRYRVSIAEHSTVVFAADPFEAARLCGLAAGPDGLRVERLETRPGPLYDIAVEHRRRRALAAALPRRCENCFWWRAPRARRISRRAAASTLRAGVCAEPQRQVRDAGGVVTGGWRTLRDDHCDAFLAMGSEQARTAAGTLAGKLFVNGEYVGNVERFEVRDDWEIPAPPTEPVGAFIAPDRQWPAVHLRLAESSTPVAEPVAPPPTTEETS